MRRLKQIILVSALTCGGLLASCGDNDNAPVFPDVPEVSYDMTGFAKGADVSWLTEMENSGITFYDTDGNSRECMSLLRDLGMNAIRLRVWVNPGNDVFGWCDGHDVLIKAWRARQLGFRLMIDFHYSDTWADPGKQGIPAAWEGLDAAGLEEAIANHTREVLSLLKTNGIDVEWVQVGNEVHQGMLFPTGQTTTEDGSKNFARFTAAGYDAVKEVYPDAQVIVHLDQGQNASLYNRIFDGLEQNGGKWDIIGMSLYPNMMPESGEPDDWEAMNTACIANMNALIAKYGTPVMMCEIGVNWNYEGAEAFFADFLRKAQGVEQCLGTFTWEPQSYNGWKGYHKGMFDDGGHPTDAFKPFAR
ncbi:MAG: arabinogalactan endo-1,4-beta-galactosidase [Mediterranea sp.]|jgi:arabinogalactan endo-1,4-beta-galactosidase|nr:arabinogalactan endo-1,4-beta-galactosidase [Mediterranea sp.]